MHLDNEFGIPVLAGIVHHQVNGWFTIGFAARPDLEQAALKAWTEALTLPEGSRDLAVENSLIRQAVDWDLASYAGRKPWRADRRYVDDYRHDFRDVSDLMCQQQICLDPRAVDAVRPWTDVPATRTVTDLPRLPDRSLRTYPGRTRLARRTPGRGGPELLAQPARLTGRVHSHREAVVDGRRTTGAPGDTLWTARGVVESVAAMMAA